MHVDKRLLAGNTTLLLLKLLEEKDLYGYQMIEELDKRSDRTFELKTGTLYPLLHRLEEKGIVTAYEKEEGTHRLRRYHHLSQKGKGVLEEKPAEWKVYTQAVNRVLKGGERHALA